MRVAPRHPRVAAGGAGTGGAGASGTGGATTDGTAPAGRAPVSLDDVYRGGDGRALMSGIQAIVRLVLDQRRLDRSRGLDTAAFVSGYEGSPLAGLDLELDQARRRLEEEGVVFAPALNEELAATAVAGSQLLADVPGHDHDGVVGFWYGKNPGLDRAADAIRHGNHAGTAPLGGAVALIGDDPTCKSSTLPSSSMSMARSLSLPLLSPGSVSEVMRLGLHAVALSRYSGLWVGLQIVADVADGSAVVDLGAPWPEIPAPDTTRVAHTPLLVGPNTVEAEEQLVGVRLPRALEYARLSSLNAVTLDPPRARLGIMAAGYTYATTLRALEDMGLDAEACTHLGVRLIRISLPWPLDGAELRRLTAGLDEVVVIEDKASFVESQLKEALYGRTEQPLVVGKLDPEGRPLVPASGSVDSDTVDAGARRRGFPPTGFLPPPDRVSTPSPGDSSSGCTPLRPRPRAGVLLRMPAQHVHPVRRRPAGGAGDRLPHHGRL